MAPHLSIVPDTPARHIYVSTACVHDDHVRCRRQCKFCGDPCKCDCHLFGPDSPLNGGGA